MNRKESIVSAVVSCLVLVNAILTAKGYTIDFGAVYTIASYVLAAAAFVWSFWKNHNFTQAAQAAQGYLHEMKSQITDEELDASDEDGEENE